MTELQHLIELDEVPPEPKKTVALVGMAVTNRDQAPWDDEDIEIWTLNESVSKRFGYIERVTRHFQLHPLWNCMREGNQNDPEHSQWLRVQKDFPIYMQDHYDEIPMSVRYPKEEIFERFKISLDGPDHWREFDSTLPYMLALALYEGFDRIEIYGFEMGSETEYEYQRPNVHLWMGMARMAYLLTGKPEIYIPDECKLLGWGTKLYGYEMIKGINPMEIEIDRNKFGNQMARLRDVVLEIEGRQKELNDQLAGLKQQFDVRAKEIADKKMDEKLKRRRLDELTKEFEAKGNPVQRRIQAWHNKKVELREAMLVQQGAHMAAQNWKNRYDSMGKPDDRLDLPDVSMEAIEAEIEEELK